jgi:WD repeat-containing protein 55
LKIDEDTLLTGSSDGLIRVVQIHPDKLLGVLGDHDGFPVERLNFNADRSLVGSATHDNMIRLWDARILREDYDDDGEDGKERDFKMDATSWPQAQLKTGQESDDEWENMDEGVDEAMVDVNDDEDSDDDEEDDDDVGKKATGKNDKRANQLKSENDRFFEDL